jgi:hypothetical protein
MAMLAGERERGLAVTRQTSSVGVGLKTPSPPVPSLGKSSVIRREGKAEEIPNRSNSGKELVAKSMTRFSTTLI